MGQKNILKKNGVEILGNLETLVGKTVENDDEDDDPKPFSDAINKTLRPDLFYNCRLPDNWKVRIVENLPEYNDMIEKIDELSNKLGITPLEKEMVSEISAGEYYSLFFYDNHGKRRFIECSQGQERVYLIDDKSFFFK